MVNFTATNLVTERQLLTKNTKKSDMKGVSSTQVHIDVTMYS